MGDCVKPLDICDRRLVASKDVDVPLLDCDGCGEVSVPVELWLLSPAVVLDAVDLTGLGRVVEARSNCIDEAVAYSSQTVPFSGVHHVR